MSKNSSSVFARWHTLSPEALSCIFLLASHSVPPGAGRIEADATVFLELRLDSEPCTFTRICKSWRKVALSIPQLWSHIAIDIGYKAPKSEDLRADCEEDRKSVV